MINTAVTSTSICSRKKRRLSLAVVLLYVSLCMVLLICGLVNRSNIRTKRYANLLSHITSYKSHDRTPHQQQRQEGIPPTKNLHEAYRGKNNTSAREILMPTLLRRQLRRQERTDTMNHSLTSYEPGNLVESDDYYDLWVSKGVSCNRIAKAEEYVEYYDGYYSNETFHDDPDGAAVFDDVRPYNLGGWIYVSNAESKTNGGVGALTFNSLGQVIDYRYVLSKGQTQQNCGGGKTPWNTWITCEEKKERNGYCWQVDPTGRRAAERSVISDPGRLEGAAVDIRDPNYPHFYVTEDEEDGPLRRYTPSEGTVSKARERNDPWLLMHGEGGKMEYLVLDDTSQTFHWSPFEEMGKRSAYDLFPGSEGIDIVNNLLFFVSKENYKLWTLDLDLMKYAVTSTRQGTFDGRPDQVKSIVGTNGVLYLYVTEDGENPSGLHGFDKYHRSFTVLEGRGETYKGSGTAGLAFSPNNMHLYVAFQKKEGALFDCTRDDGLSFNGETVSMRYYSPP